MAKNPRNLGRRLGDRPGSTSEVGVGALPGLEVLDDDVALGDKLITTQTLRPAQVTEDKVRDHFFDLTAHGRGVLASVRSGQLKKDLSLLFEKDNSELPAPYKFNSGATEEPSIRPMSSDLLERSPKITNRHFASWTNTRQVLPDVSPRQHHAQPRHRRFRFS